MYLWYFGPASEGGQILDLHVRLPVCNPSLWVNTFMKFFDVTVQILFQMQTVPVCTKISNSDAAFTGPVCIRVRHLKIREMGVCRSYCTVIEVCFFVLFFCNPKNALAPHFHTNTLYMTTCLDPFEKGQDMSCCVRHNNKFKPSLVI